MRLFGIFCGLIISTLSQLGCDQHSSRSLFKDYQYRMGNVLDVPIQSASVIDLTPYPSLRSLRQELSQGSINIIEFWKIRACKLHTLLGEKNNSLGKVMPTSQEWIYAAKFLNLAPVCISTLKLVENNESPSDSILELIDELSGAVSTKQKEKYRYAWNSTLASKEFAYLFSLASAPIPTNSIGAANLREAWKNLFDLLTQYDARNAIPSNIEQELKMIASSRYIGSLMQSVRLVSNELLPITQALEEKSRSCRLNTREKTALKNVFVKHYAGRVQPYLARVHQEIRVYQPLLLQLIKYFRNHQKNMDAKALSLIDRYYLDNWSQPNDESQNTESSLTKMKQVILNHARAWQKLSHHCGLDLVPE